jgi:hypothetical protein
LHGRRLDAFPQDVMKTAAGDHIRLGAEYLRGALLDIHEFIETDGANLVVKEEIYVRRLARVIAGRRTKQIEVFDSELP